MSLHVPGVSFQYWCLQLLANFQTLDWVGYFKQPIHTWRINSKLVCHDCWLVNIDHVNSIMPLCMSQHIPTIHMQCPHLLCTRLCESVTLVYEVEVPGWVDVTGKPALTHCKKYQLSNFLLQYIYAFLGTLSLHLKLTLVLTTTNFVILLYTGRDQWTV